MKMQSISWGTASAQSHIFYSTFYLFPVKKPDTGGHYSSSTMAPRYIILLAIILVTYDIISYLCIACSRLSILIILLLSFFNELMVFNVYINELKKN